MHDFTRFGEEPGDVLPQRCVIVNEQRCPSQQAPWRLSHCALEWISRTHSENNSSQKKIVLNFFKNSSQSYLVPRARGGSTGSRVATRVAPGRQGSRADPPGRCQRGPGRVT